MQKFLTDCFMPAPKEPAVQTFQPWKLVSTPFSLALLHYPIQNLTSWSELFQLERTRDDSAPLEPVKRYFDWRILQYFFFFFNSGSALLILGFMCYNIERKKGYFLNAKKIIMFFSLFFLCQRDEVHAHFFSSSCSNLLRCYWRLGRSSCSHFLN